MEISRDAPARMIDHILLRTGTTPAQVPALVVEARKLGVFSVCVSPSMLLLTDDLASLKVATMCSFPSDNYTPATKATEAVELLRLDADEIDMVISIGYLKAGEVYRAVEEIIAVHEAATGLLKVIIESAALADGGIVTACQAAEGAGANFVKISTGFHPVGGTNTYAVALTVATVDGRLGIKASGSVCDRATVREMVAAGVTRLGLSTSHVILGGTPI